MDSKDNSAIDAARLYYLLDLSQSEVAKELGVSRPTVSKLLTYAREKGFVRIEIDDPRESGSDLASQLKQQFGLDEVVVAPGRARDAADVNAAIGRLGAQTLQSLLDDGTVLGVSWGRTMYSIARHLEFQNLRNVEVVQLKGGMSHSGKATHDFETIDLFCRALNAHASLLPLPAVFQNREVKSLVEAEPHIRSVMDRGAHADVVVFTVGAATPDSVLFQLGYFSEEDKAKILTNAVGDICSRWVDLRGNICCPDVDSRTVGISLEGLKSRPVRLLVAGGLEKAEAIEVALRNGYASHLVIDAITGEKVLQISSQMGAHL
ncbi:sugar-binding transcriptional regulator [Corynebacterium epidermidicanis]|uniref:Transcriptional regulator with sigma factor-related N-terminal domain n=1 Tax=Corynebacterium epidermidicanis TaxID=1050174 RepID=A0A0G3GS51_9CORY|nr:sugar-binding transcriptional regulator [Corynebacterium epidermidicanis]AKK02378.1 transcriptional regulator with sigma factor-related N-terminal domain [Corynebacterium epidermidicanis]